ncbi:hypothetical protein [Pseudomonas aeruginosa]|uniref:hypothetical protein n=1 Tax=Pseudomonas aeruginosa TaxID=287 RepID=UPI002044DFDE|nr:hypothetical protein [Pseudomonas aeruginosa]
MNRFDTAWIHESYPPIQVVDLFAGPGGLGEGFSSYRDSQGEAFEIKVSAEMEKSAHSTLQLRAFYRLLKRNQPEDLEEYYSFCETADAAPHTPAELEMLGGTPNKRRNSSNWVPQRATNVSIAFSSPAWTRPNHGF